MMTLARPEKIIQTITVDKEVTRGVKMEHIIQRFAPAEFRMGHIDSFCATVSKIIIDIKHPEEDRICEIKLQ